MTSDLPGGRSHILFIVCNNFNTNLSFLGIYFDTFGGALRLVGSMRNPGKSGSLIIKKEAHFAPPS